MPNKEYVALSTFDTFFQNEIRVETKIFTSNRYAFRWSEEIVDIWMDQNYKKYKMGSSFSKLV